MMIIDQDGEQTRYPPHSYFDSLMMVKTSAIRLKMLLCSMFFYFQNIL